MYADRYAGRPGLNPGGLLFALGASGFLLFGLSLSAPNFVEKIETHLHIRNIELPKDPPPREKPKPQPEIKQPRQAQPLPLDPVDPTKLVVPTVPSGPVARHIDPPPLPPVAPGAGDPVLVVAPHSPVVIGPQLDSRYIDNFQPNYPSDERLAGHDGRVVVRVLIGTDGRVKDVQQISAASTAFFEATRKQALAKWRFKPGTKDGVAVEAWRTMAVSFVLNED